MRPAILNPLFAPVTTLSGVGPKQDKLLRYLLSCSETPRLVDLLLHLPASVIDRRNAAQGARRRGRNRGDARSHRRPPPPVT
ncbi:RecG-like helicase [Bradyrhizobium sp. USDA 4369]